MALRPEVARYYPEDMLAGAGRLQPLTQLATETIVLLASFFVTKQCIKSCLSLHTLEQRYRLKSQKATSLLGAKHRKEGDSKSSRLHFLLPFVICLNSGSLLVSATLPSNRGAAAGVWKTLVLRFSALLISSARSLSMNSIAEKVLSKPCSFGEVVFLPDGMQKRHR